VHEKQNLFMNLRHQAYSAPGVPSGDYDDEDYKDVFYPSHQNVELAMAAQVRTAFERAGYHVWHWAKADTHPVWILRARRKLAPRVGDNVQFTKHIMSVLKGAGISGRKGDITIDRNGDAILVAFAWPLRVRVWTFDENSGWAPDPLAA